MSITLQISVSLIFTYPVLLLDHWYTCTKPDVYSYYTKDYGQICRRHGYTELNESDLDISVTNSYEDEDMASNSGLNGLYRPRSALARALYEKQQNDRHLQEFDQNEWYRVDKSRLSPELQEKFVQLEPDHETKEFLSSSIDKSSWVWTQIWYLLAKAVLKHFWTITDINGWLGRGSMFVLSAEQARTLLGAAKRGSNNAGSVVDIGAGDGEVSRRFAHLYTNKYATEISGCMRKALSSKGFTILDTEDWWREQRFDCVCMLNLLDRCAKPRSMLQQAKAAIAPDGVLLLALVLPYKPYVEVTSDHKPEERLPIQNVNFEEQVASFVQIMRDEIGFELAAWSRAPYLCEGDFAQAYYWLDDSVWLGRGSMFVLSAEQARTLLGAAKRGSNNAGSVVDIGAGDGEVSRRFAHLYTNKYATEISGCMRKALSSKGFTILDTEDWWREQRFDCVCMLNLLDRCAKPRSMLQQAKAAIAPDGVLLLALVLPYKPYVVVTSDHKPEERLPIQGVNFEEQVASFVQIMRDEIGFELAAWSRAPYLCEGDFAQAYYWLDDSVYVFTPSRT